MSKNVTSKKNHVIFISVSISKLQADVRKQKTEVDDIHPPTLTKNKH